MKFLVLSLLLVSFNLFADQERVSFDCSQDEYQIKIDEVDEGMVMQTIINKNGKASVIALGLVNQILFDFEYSGMGSYHLGGDFNFVFSVNLDEKEASFKAFGSIFNMELPALECK